MDLGEGLIGAGVRGVMGRRALHVRPPRDEKNRREKHTRDCIVLFLSIMERRCTTRKHMIVLCVACAPAHDRPALSLFEPRAAG